MKHTQIDSTHFTLITWDDIAALTETVAEEVANGGGSYDRIIAIANGGLTMARHFGDRLGMKKISLLQTAFYADINKREEEPTILQPLAVDVTGEHLLVFEDIVDTGKTLEFIRPLLLDQYDAASVSIASLISKSWASVQPDFVAAQLDTWIIYPYETRESIESLSAMWRKKDLNDAEINKRLLDIGFNTHDIRRYFRYNES
ncbi:hypothetical protein LRY65_04920 [Candidatus Woesebacteria bacterium]|nr:hypothetical protein [Candidatus Woesebacteria bacterium]MCD8506869.1 hypothetical protein [Candidatus Woesebacteria bacterium]MCD8527512.1 hypothetical protein [Candidatus Woesebacteria bacterium]MCD8546252.1 hypothetical protein [Candidatus Woesebacteria bacterium]